MSRIENVGDSKFEMSRIANVWQPQDEGESRASNDATLVATAQKSADFFKQRNIVKILLPYYALHCKCTLG